MTAARRSVPTGRAELQARIVRRFRIDEAFRERLRTDAAAALRDELGTELPADLEVIVVEERRDRMCVVIPVDQGTVDATALGVVTGAEPWF